MLTRNEIEQIALKLRMETSAEIRSHARKLEQYRAASEGEFRERLWREIEDQWDNYTDEQKAEFQVYQASEKLEGAAVYLER